MEWKEKIISLYLYICGSEAIKNYLHSLRQSNNNVLEFTDEEAMTIYLNGVLQKRSKVKDIYNYTKDHLTEWFPTLPSYQAFDNRLNTIAGAFVIMSKELIREGMGKLNFISESLIDSMPIIVAGNRRSSIARVAKEVCNKGYCSSKDMYYYGVKLHFIGFVRPQTIPMPEFCWLSGAKENDLTEARPVLERIYNRKIYGDKIYLDESFNIQLQQENNTEILAPIKKQKGQKLEDAADNLFSKAVSSVRQPVESFFNWINEKTNIQDAIKIRSSKGLWTHVWGKVAAALCALCVIF